MSAITTVAQTCSRRHGRNEEMAHVKCPICGLGAAVSLSRHDLAPESFRCECGTAIHSDLGFYISPMTACVSCPESDGHRNEFAAVRGTR